MHENCDNNEPSNRTKYSYDPMGRLKQQWYWTPQDPNFNASAYVVYDKAGDINTVAYPDGRVVSQSFNGAGSLLSVSDQWNDYASSLAYDAASQMTSGNLGTGLTVSASYNPRLVITELYYGTTYAWAKNYTWNLNLTLQQEQNLLNDTTRKYGYDTLNRLTSALDVVTGTNNPASGGLSESYSYDQFGDLTQTGNFSFEPEQWYTSNQPYPSTTWKFDAAGDLTNDYNLGNTYTYDGESKLTAANSVSYIYYADGSRAGKTGSTPTDYIPFNGGPLTRYTGSNTWKDLIPGFNGTLAEVPYSGGSGTPVYRYTDHLRSSVVYGGQTQDYAPFGQLFNGDDTSDPYKFTGKEYDSESGNEYFGARFYSSVMGRFLSPDPGWTQAADPSNPQSFNQYAYVLNLPTSLDDPNGLYPPTAAEDCFEELAPSPGNATLPDISTLPGCNAFFAGLNKGPNGGLVSAAISSAEMSFEEDVHPNYIVAGGHVLLPIPSSPIWYPNYNYNPSDPNSSRGAFYDFNGYVDVENLAAEYAQADVPSLWSDWAHSMKTCFWDVGVATVGNDLNPFKLGAYNSFDAAQGVANVISASKFNSALSYAATRGLTYPFKSSVFRGMLSASETVGKVADAMPLLALDVALIHANVAEVRQCF